MAVVIPTDVLPFYTQRTSLSGRDFVLTFYWSTREECWYLNLATESEEEIVSGIKLVCHIPLLSKLASDNKPEGGLIVISTTEDDSPPGLEDLAENTGRCQLVYYV